MVINFEHKLEGRSHIQNNPFLPDSTYITVKALADFLQAINPMELAMEALKEIQTRFYRDFPPHPQEEVYGFATPSTMKPTQWSCKLTSFCDFFGKGYLHFPMVFFFFPAFTEGQKARGTKEKILVFE